MDKKQDSQNTDSKNDSKEKFSFDMTQVQSKLGDKQNPQDSRTWEELAVSKPLIDVLLLKGFKKPSQVQTKVLLLSKKMSVIGQAQNGSGKTLAFLIPCIEALDPKISGKDEYGTPAPQIIIVGDTKALILQINKIISNILDSLEGYQSVEIDYMFGGKPDMRVDVQVLLCTIAQLRKNVLKKKVSLKKIKWVVFDEADHVVEEDATKNFAIKLFKNYLKDIDYKFILTSATKTEDLEDVIEVLKPLKKFGRFEVEQEKLTLKNVYQFLIKYSTEEQKFETLRNMIEKLDVQNILIFGNNKKRLKKLGDYLTSHDHKVAYTFSLDIHYTEQPQFIEKQMKDFLAGKYRVLLATNLIARGIDMRKVTLVINFELPLKFTENKSAPKQIDPETYLHRVGRTGRFGDQGFAINLVDKNKDMTLIKSLQEFYKTSPMEELEISNLNEVNQILQKIQEVNVEKRKELGEDIEAMDDI